MNKNLYNYRPARSGNQETRFMSPKGRISRRSFILRMFFSMGLLFTFYLIYLNHFFVRVDSRAYIFCETLYFYILPLYVFLFVLIQGFKRMHDINKSGFYFLVPFLNIYLAFLKGTEGNNNYGIDPDPEVRITYFDELKSAGVIEGDTSNISSKKSNSYWYISILAIIITILIFTTDSYKPEINAHEGLTLDSNDTYLNDTPQHGNYVSSNPTAAEIRAKITWQSENDGYFIDSRDNYEYAVRRIGNQIWMIDNLKYASEESVSLRCDPTNDSKGRLYNWDDAKECVPEGWKLPSWTDYNNLLNRLSQNELLDPMYFNLYSAGNAFLDIQRCEAEFPQWNDWTCLWTSTRYGNEVAWALIHYDTGLQLNWSDSYRKGRTEFGAYYGIRCILDE